MILSVAALILTARRPGRPKAEDDPGRRQDHIRCATLLLSGQATPDELAGMFGISRRTVYNWRDLALGYDDVEAEGLRRLFGRGRG